MKANKYLYVLQGDYGNGWVDLKMSPSLRDIQHAKMEYQIEEGGDYRIVPAAMSNQPATDGQKPHANEDQTMFCIIEHTYVGPNAKSDEWIDWNHVTISEIPRSHDDLNVIRNNRGQCLIGTADTLDEATALVSTVCNGEYRTIQEYDSTYAQGADPKYGIKDSEGPNPAVYKPGRLTKWGTESSSDWIAASWDSVTADTTDEQIEALAGEILKDVATNADAELCYGRWDVEDLLIDHRAELRDELADE